MSSPNQSPDPKVVVACDFDNLSTLERFVDSVDPALCKLKIGKELFTYFGPQAVKPLVNKGFDVFLDLKFHDIPNTVAKACLAAADLGVWMINVHASGGAKMMSHTMAQLQQFGPERPKLIAVTVLTSMDETQLHQVTPDIAIIDQVQKLAALSHDSGLDGVVCSAREAKVLRQQFKDDFLLVTPGIRPVGSDVGDQIRVMTPPQAMLDGVSYMVIGRPITQSADPVQTLLEINQSIA
ncbi:MAG: orotidine-5'-phosphate decarboxylase [Glaciecola sp.]|jgi:orotidine-5'-phosphate decarboxylase